MKSIADDNTTVCSNDLTEKKREQTAAPQPKVHGVLIGVLAAITEDGQPCVTYPGNLAVLPTPARATATISTDSIGSEVALLFENGDIGKPIIMGIIQTAADIPHLNTTIQQSIENESAKDTVELWSPDSESSGLPPSEVIIDGKRISLHAQEQLVLRCGKSSITMTRAGKVIIRGAYVSSKSSGANRIKGGSVQIN